MTNKTQSAELAIQPHTRARKLPVNLAQPPQNYSSSEVAVISFIHTKCRTIQFLWPLEMCYNRNKPRHFSQLNFRNPHLGTDWRYVFQSHLPWKKTKTGIKRALSKTNRFVGIGFRDLECLEITEVSKLTAYYRLMYPDVGPSAGFQQTHL